MVVLCPNCGREIFSDPDSCVMCGWRRGAPPPREVGRERGPPHGPPATQRRPPQRYPQRRGEGGYDDRAPREPEYGAPPQRDYADRERPRYRGREESYDQRMPRREVRRERGYPEGYGQRSGMAYPPPRDQRPYPGQRREPPYQRRMAREAPPPRYGDEAVREPPRDIGRGEYREPVRNYCPNCGREILTDPDNCVLCGWSREMDERRAPRINEQRRGYPRQPPPGYQERQYQGISGQEYGQEGMRRQPPEGWERQVEDRMRGRVPPQKRERRALYRPETKARRLKKEGTKDRFVCENCGNPSLQFFADGLGRCPACGYRFRFSARPMTVRSKQKHKQFICSNCDSKNLQFFLDGGGFCPQCKREFRWKK